MRYEVSNKLVIFYLDNPKRAEDAVATQSFANTRLSEQQLIPVFESLVKRFSGQKLASQRTGATSIFLRPLFAYFHSTGIEWPDTSLDWQVLVFGFFQFYLSDTTWSQSKAGLRMRLWQTKIGGLLEFLKEEEVIPLDVSIPKIDKKRIKSHAHDQPLLGRELAKTSDFLAQPKKLLVDISFSMNDADYLTSVEQQCKHLIAVIQNVCTTHWDGLMQDIATGKQIADLISNDEMKEVIANEKFKIYSEKNHGMIFLTSPFHPNGHNWFLAVVRNMLAMGTSKECISQDSLRQSSFFKKSLFRINPELPPQFMALTSMAPEVWRKLKSPARLYRFAGVLSPLDAAAACCLLTIEHPEFTSESLQNAKLMNVNGKSYLLLTDTGESYLFSVDKPRKGKRISVVLTDRSQKLVLDIIRSTTAAREILKRAGDKTWRYLFLGVSSVGTIGVVEAKPRYLNGRSGTVGLGTLYPELSNNNLSSGSFDYRRLRNTLGVIRWFETGSILEMSRRLGNSRKVALEHYIPAVLLHAWNTRIIRRFQNTLIVLAAHNEPYLLDVTDFSNLADLQHFISQLIVEYPDRSSPLAEQVQIKLGSEGVKEFVNLGLPSSLLCFHLSPQSLAFLYSYSEIALRSLSASDLDKVDVISGLAPRQFTEMAALLRHGAESDTINLSLRELLDVPLLKKVHGEALAIKVAIDEKLNHIAIKRSWVNAQ